MDILLNLISGINSLVFVMISNPIENKDDIIRDYEILVSHLTIMIRGFNLASENQVELVPFISTNIQHIYFYKIAPLTDGTIY